MTNYKSLAGALLLLTVWMGCDTAPGVVEQDPPPFLSGLSVEPSRARLQDLPPEQVGENDVQIPVQIEANIENASLVSYTIFLSGDPTAQVATGELTSAGGTAYSSTPTLVIPKGALGLYTVSLTAFGAQNESGNRLLGQFEYFSDEGSAPVIVDVTAPESVEIPTEDGTESVFQVIANVEDEDGLENILRVVMRTGGGTEFDLRDDGGEDSNSGDETAGDGLFTGTFAIGVGQTPGSFDFDIQATDRTGLESEVVTITIVLE